MPAFVAENKASNPNPSATLIPSHPAVPRRFLFAGTLAESYGLFDTFPLMDSIARLLPAVEYVICGHCPIPQTRRRLQEEARRRPWVELRISEQPLPHHAILQELQRCHFSLVAYRLNPSNKDCMPTKIWEALAWQKPMILKPGHPWISILDAYQAGFAIDFMKPDEDILLHQLLRKDYYPAPPPASIYWESVAPNFVAFIDELFPEKLSE